MSEIEMLVKLRDALQMGADALEEYIQTKAPVDKRWDPNKIRWEKAEGTRGPYEKSSNESSEDARNMLKDLKDHNGRMWRQGYFYWVFDDQATCGRKRKKKS